MHEFLFLKPETSVVSCRNEFVKKYNFTSIFAKLSALNHFSKTLKNPVNIKTVSCQEPNHKCFTEMSYNLA